MKWFKLIILLAIQAPISIFYYQQPGNPIYFLIYQLVISFILVLQDNAISYNFNAMQVLNHNFEELLAKILKAVPKQPKGSDDMDNEI